MAECVELLNAAFLAVQEEELLLLAALDQPKRKHECWVREWIVEKEDNECNTAYKLQKRLLQCDTKEYCRMVRMSPEVFEMVLEAIRPIIERQDTNWRKSISAEERLSMTLKYLATGESPLSLGTAYRVGRCTVGRVIKDTCRAIFQVFRGVIKTPRTSQEWEAIMNGFDQRWNYPGCLGAIDGKHIRLAKPWLSGSTYWNYKKFYSVILMGVVNANYEFIYVNVGAEGKTADGGVWQGCDFQQAVQNNTLQIPDKIGLKGSQVQISPHLVADDAFPMGNRILKPFTHIKLPDREAIFSYRLSRARRVVENVFGICASRFRCLRGEISMNPDSAVDVVLAITVLHNLLRKTSGASYIPHGSVDYEDNNYVIHPGDWRLEENNIPGLDPTFARNPTRAAKKMREDITDYFMSPSGSVEWQFQHIHNRLDRLLMNARTIVS